MSIILTKMQRTGAGSGDVPVLPEELLTIQLAGPSLRLSTIDVLGIEVFRKFSGSR